MKVEHFEPALEAAMAEQLANVDKITAEGGQATFANTIAALERSDRLLRRVLSVYEVWSSTLDTPDFRAVETRMAPRVAAFQDRITQNAKLFERIGSVDETRDRSTEINQRLASLFTRFSQNVLADEQEYALFLEEEADLAGLPDAFRSSAASAAEERGHKGEWAVTNTRSSVEPFLAHSDRRDLREKVWRAFASRGDGGGERDNKPIVAEILALRAERARLLEYETHAHWRLAHAMAKTPERAMALLGAMAKRLRDRIFAVGNTVDPAEAYPSFRGRDAGVEALLRKRGFPVPEPPKE